MTRLFGFRRVLKLLMIGVLSAVFLAPAAFAHPGDGSEPAYAPPPAYSYGPGWGWSWYDPFPWGWGYPYVYPFHPYSGVVKLQELPGDALVYVDDGYAGRADKLKKFTLRAGNHEIELRDSSGHAFQKERIHVIPGKTLKIRGMKGGR